MLVAPDVGCEWYNLPTAARLAAPAHRTRSGLGKSTGVTEASIPPTTALPVRPPRNIGGKVGKRDGALSDTLGGPRVATSEVPSLVPRDRGGPSPHARHLPNATRLHNTSERVLRETAAYAA